jgi:hypothetical protein
VPVYLSALVNCSVVRLELTSTRADAQSAAQTLRGLSLRSSMVLRMAVLIAATGFRADAYVTDGAAFITRAVKSGDALLEIEQQCRDRAAFEPPTESTDVRVRVRVTRRIEEDTLARRREN